MSKPFPVKFTGYTLLRLSSGLIYTYFLLGQVSLLRQDYEFAEQYFQRSLEMGRKIESQFHIAQAKQGIAGVKLALGLTDQTQKIAQEATEIFSRLGAKRELRKTRALLEAIK